MVAKHYRLGVIGDLECHRMVALMDFCSEQSYFNGSYRWMMFSRGTLQSALSVLKTQDLNIDTRLTLALLSGKSEILAYDLYEVYGTIHRRDGNIRVVDVGTWDSELGSNWTCSTNLYNIRKDLGNVQLWSTTMTFNIPKGVTLEEHLQNMLPPKKYSADRYGYRVTKLLSYHHNFRLKLILTKDWSLGLASTNSTSRSGILGQLRQKVVDMSSTLLGLQMERLDSFDPTVQISTGVCITIFRHPRNDASRNIFLKPFNDRLWVAIIGVLIIASLVLLTAFFYAGEICSLWNLQFIFAMFAFSCQQGHSLTTVVDASRVIIVTLLWFTFLMYQFYSTSIIGYLLVAPPKTIRTLDQLLASDLKYSIEDLNYNRDFFERTKNTTALQLYERKILPNKLGFVNVSTGIALVKAGGHAFHCEAAYGNTWILETFDVHEVCELQEMKLFPTRAAHLILPKGSPLRDLFRVSLRRMLETGVMQYYRRKFYVEKPKCIQSSLALVKVDFWDTITLCKLLAWASLAGFIVLFVELVVFRVKVHFEMIRFRTSVPIWID